MRFKQTKFGFQQRENAFVTNKFDIPIGKQWNVHYHKPDISHDVEVVRRLQTNQQVYDQTLWYKKTKEGEALLKFGSLRICFFMFGRFR